MRAMIGSIAKYAAAGTLVVSACLLPRPAEAQSIANRVAAVRDGKVRMSFASRDDICGWGDGISTNHTGRTNNRSKWSNRSDDVDYDDECMAGPARIVLTLRDGKVEKVRSYVGGRWRTPSDATDLGTVPARDAVDYLLGVANRDDGKGAGEAIFATTLADSVDIVPRLASIAENESRSDDVRGQAVFWLGQSRTDKSGDYLRSLYRKIRDEDVRDKVIFSISQQNDDESQNWLVDLASNSSESIEMRKKALFWAGQTSTPFPRLAAMYGKMREQEMKDQMIFVFSQRHEAAALDKLMDIAKNDPDREARRKALFWLGQSRDSRVSAFLTDIINR
jgi:hypothetical protein